MQSYQGTVGVVQAQTVYTLELATMGRNDVASKEYKDFNRARQAFDDAVADELALELLGVTRVELFNDVSGSLMRWVRKEPALASPVEVQRVTELAKILPACKTPEGTIEWLKDEACKQYALRVAAVEQRDELQAEVKRLRGALIDIESGNASSITVIRALVRNALHPTEPADKDVQP